MKILLIGATGMVGSRILQEALARGHSVIAAARSVDKIQENEGVTAVRLDINDTAAVVKQAQSADIIISAVSPRNTGNAADDAERFTKSLIEVQEASGKRVIMVGGAASLHTADGTPVLNLMPKAIAPEATAMRRAYGMLVEADIDFTVLAPGGMIAPGNSIGIFRTAGRTVLNNDDGTMSNISAEDYAIAMLNEVEKPQHFRTIFNVAY